MTDTAPLDPAETLPPARSIVRTTALALLIAYGPCVAANLLQVAGLSWDVTRFFDRLAALPFMLAVFASVVMLLAAPFSCPRPNALRWAIAFGALALGFVPLHVAVDELKTWSFHNAAARAAPLVAAIERYADERGALPPTLEALVPDYIAAIPGRMPPFEYRQVGGTFELEYKYLVGAILDWDLLLYNGRHQYDRYNRVQPIGSWAFIELR